MIATFEDDHGQLRLYKSRVAEMQKKLHTLSHHIETVQQNTGKQISELKQLLKESEDERDRQRAALEANALIIRKLQEMNINAKELMSRSPALSHHRMVDLDEDQEEDEEDVMDVDDIAIKEISGDHADAELGFGENESVATSIESLDWQFQSTRTVDTSPGYHLKQQHSHTVSREERSQWLRLQRKPAFVACHTIEQFPPSQDDLNVIAVESPRLINRIGRNAPPCSLRIENEVVIPTPKPCNFSGSSGPGSFGLSESPLTRSTDEDDDDTASVVGFVNNEEEEGEVENDDESEDSTSRAEEDSGFDAHGGNNDNNTVAAAAADIVNARSVMEPEVDGIAVVGSLVLDEEMVASVKPSGPYALPRIINSLQQLSGFKQASISICVLYLLFSE
jgi:hypothetical protein